MERAVLTLASIMTCHVPAALLAAVALVQICLAGAVNPAPWEGGGFGMWAELMLAFVQR
jgi:hypothetical protein